MIEPAGQDGAVSDLVRPARGLSLLGEYKGSGFAEPRFLVRRGDGQVIQLSRLLYLVTAVIAEGGADGGWDAARVAARAGAEFGRELTADNVRYLVTGKLAPLGVRMDGYFILGDLAGVPDLLGLLGAIIASVLPGARASRAGAPAQGLRKGLRMLVTGWVLVAITLLPGMTAYAAWHLPAMISTASQAFVGDVTTARAGFATGDPAAGLAAAIGVALLVIPALGLLWLVVQLAVRGARLLLRCRVPRPARARP